MPLKIETFSNVTGGSSYFKAIGHPLAAEPARALLADLRAAGRVAVYDPLNMLEPFDEIHHLTGPEGAVDVAAVYAQNVDQIGQPLLGRPAQPVTALAGTAVDAVFVAAFDADRLVAHIRHLIPAGAKIFSLDPLKLPAELLTDRRTYLAPLNFATNYAFFRDGAGHHTRVVTANYWSSYGAAEPYLWLCLFGEDGQVLARWTQDLPGADGTVVIDSAQVRKKFDLPEFTGQLFIHVVGAAGHDVVKYALDTYGDAADTLSCTHDANAWPSDFYAGLPAPRADERVILWVQNSHPCPIPAGAVALNLMGHDSAVELDREVGPYATYALDVASLLPDARWPQQVEIRAGKHFVRPRYEVIRTDAAGATRHRIAHPNVERVDLKPDPKLATLTNLMGKGFILPAPIFPAGRFRTIALPTPMGTTQNHLPLTAIVYDADGTEVARRDLGRLPRNHETVFEAADILDGKSLPSGYGHLELIYDFAAGENDADGWLHALFRYEDGVSGHTAETSFGAHMFNTVLTYKNEPQSYSGRAPGLSTRLFLRTGMAADVDTLCHLIYPASTPWNTRSNTALILMTKDGEEVARRTVAIACSGSFHFRVGQTFTSSEVKEAGRDAYVLIRDTTCRLFGYHGLIRDGAQGAFALDHMFGF
ncbi:hypothetical protein FBZ87_105255 [Nitrospirillum amazonense]|uniref:Uncharacterized protein n=1 Tax=Nitrospirillum amazonense TaxID=28077 RepID=A0A560JUZ1_9PROT|nr:hypothetical protein [Nitrospirillum amazonense]TWB73334.1 hypothetical protein FBZ87_105255 [Nitrospirillum amazonense]